MIEIKDFSGRRPGIVHRTLVGHQDIAQHYREEAAELEARAATHEAEAAEEEADDEHPVIDVPAVEEESSSERADSDVAREPEPEVLKPVEPAQHAVTRVLLPESRLLDSAISDG